MVELALASIFLAGLLAGTHCAGMCGGIVTALSFSGAANTRPPLSRLLAYNAGRIGSYTIAGAIAGSIGAGGLLLGPQQPVQQILFVVANLMLIALGLYLAGLSRVVTHIEKLGTVLWRRLAPLTRNLLPVRNNGQALMLGALWGWLPCGLVYTILLAAVASGHPVNGALIMLAFGLGTLPNLLALGYFSATIRPWLQKRAVRLAAGFMIIAFGLVGLARSADLAAAHGTPVICHNPA